MRKNLSNSGPKKLLVCIGGGIILIAFIMALGMIVTLQQEKTDLQQKISYLETRQLPDKKFTSFDDCQQNGGIGLWTINVQFSGCLGGEAFAEYSNDEGYMYQADAFFQYSAQNLPRLLDRINVNGDPFNLKDYLDSDIDDCSYKIAKVVPSRFALVDWNCGESNKFSSIEIMLGDGWRGISITNSIDEEGRPSCLLVDMFKVSRQLMPTCFENTGFNNGGTKDVVYR